MGRSLPLPGLLFLCSSPYPNQKSYAGFSLGTDLLWVLFEGASHLKITYLILKKLIYSKKHIPSGIPWATACSSTT